MLEIIMYWNISWIHGGTVYESVVPARSLCFEIISGVTHEIPNEILGTYVAKEHTCRIIIFNSENERG